MRSPATRVPWTGRSSGTRQPPSKLAQPAREELVMSRLLSCAAALGFTVSAIGFTSSAVATGSSANCSVVGTWELTGVSQDGKPVASPRQQRKMVTGRHFMWISQAGRRDTLPLKTRADSLLYFRVIGGAGSYTTTGDSYV